MRKTTTPKEVTIIQTEEHDVRHRKYCRCIGNLLWSALFPSNTDNGRRLAIVFYRLVWNIWFLFLRLGPFSHPSKRVFSTELHILTYDTYGTTFLSKLLYKRIKLIGLGSWRQRWQIYIQWARTHFSLYNKPLVFAILWTLLCALVPWPICRRCALSMCCPYFPVDTAVRLFRLPPTIVRTGYFPKTPCGAHLPFYIQCRQSRSFIDTLPPQRTAPDKALRTIHLPPVTSRHKVTSDCVHVYVMYAHTPRAVCPNTHAAVRLLA